MTTTRSIAPSIARFGPSHRARLLLALSLTAAPVTSQDAVVPADPFATEVRWSHGPVAGSPWLPRDVTMTADGELVWAAATLDHAHLALYAAASVTDQAAPLFQGPTLTDAIGVIPVAAGGPSHLYAAPQFPDPDLSHRRTEVVRYDGVAAALGAPFEPVWTYALPILGNGPTLIDGDADALVAAVHDPILQEVHLTWIDPATGTPGVAVTRPGGSLGALAMAAGGARVALTAGTELWIVNADGTTALHETLASASSCLALSADGGTACVGGFSEARLFVDDGAGGFAESAPIAGGVSEIAAAAAIAPTGDSIAVGFWNYSGGGQVHFVWSDLGGPVMVDNAWSATTTLQNYPQEIAFSADGSRVALAMWGQGGPEPEVVLYQRGASASVASWDLPGSPMALAIASDGTRLSTAMKATHANQFATSGEVVLLETGERDLQLVAPPRPGEAMELALLAPDATQGVFGFGTESATAGVLPGVSGTLFLDLSAPLFTAMAPADALGRVDLAVPLPSALDMPLLVGFPIAVQAVGISPAAMQLSETLVLPAIL